MQKNDIDLIVESMQADAKKIEEKSEGVHDQYKKKNRRVRIFRRDVYTKIGLFIMGVAVVGVICIMLVAGIWIKSLFQPDYTEYRRIVYPAVISDFPEFETISEVSGDKVITAAIWEILLHRDIGQYQINFDVVNVPEKEIEDAAVKMFGEFNAEHTSVTIGSYRIYYNVEKKYYTIPTTPEYYSYYPQVVSADTKSDKSTVVLIVAYNRDMPRWQDELDRIQPGAAKYFEFKLKDGVIVSAKNISSRYNLDSVY